MPFDRFLIAPVDTGLVKNVPPWLIPDEAFDYMQNAYVFRGRIRKRYGSSLMGVTQYNSRLRASLASGGPGVGVTDGSGDASGNVLTILGDSGLTLSVGQSFSIGMQQYIIVSNLINFSAKSFSLSIYPLYLMRISTSSRISLLNSFNSGISSNKLNMLICGRVTILSSFIFWGISEVPSSISLAFTKLGSIE